MLFLMNTVVLELDGASDPRSDKNFPLSGGELAAIPLNMIVGMLTEAFGKDPELVTNDPALIGRFAWMLYLRGEINAVKIVHDEGLSTQYGRVPELALGVLFDMQMRKPLTLDIVDQGVWRKLKKQG